MRLSVVDKFCNTGFTMVSGVQRGSERGDGPGHPMSEVTKFKFCNQMIFPILRLLTHSAWI